MRRVALGLLALLTVVPAGPARAHGTVDPRLAPVLDRVQPPLPDRVVLQIRTADVPQFVAANPTATELSALDVDGRPFLRISSAGVYGDVASAGWWNSLLPDVNWGGTPKPTPEWKLISRGSSWGWFDHRLHPTRGVAWQAALRYGGTDHQAQGRIVTRTLGSFVPTFDRAPPGELVAELLPGRIPGLFLRATGLTQVVVYGGSGEPFARLTAAAAEVNAASPTYVEDQRLRGAPPPAGVLDPAAAPVWRPAGTSLTWLDPRLAFPPGPPPEKKRTIRWTLPVEVGGRRTELAGKTAWLPLGTPADDGGGRPWLVPLVTALLAGLAITAALLGNRAKKAPAPPARGKQPPRRPGGPPQRRR